MPELTEDAFRTAVEHHQAGRLPQAEQLYRQILSREPKHAGALHYLGLIAGQVGRPDAAAELIGQAITLRPNWAEAYISLGNALKDQGQWDEAIVEYRKAVSLKPNWPEALGNLGNALGEKGQLDEAIVAHREAVALAPKRAESHRHLGKALRDKGLFDEAIAAYRRAIVIKPDYADAHANLGGALKDVGQLDSAIAAYRQAIVLNPGYAEAHNNLGVALRDKGQLDDALTAFRRAVELKDAAGFPEAFNNMGVALGDKGRFDDAIAAYRRAIGQKPNFDEAYNNLGVALGNKGKPDEAIEAFRRAIAINPNCFSAQGSLGNALKDTGQLDEAIAAYRQAMIIDPNSAKAHGNLVYVLHFHPGYSARDIADEQGRWNHRHAELLREFIRPHTNDRTPERRLRIGYVSPDFREHPVGRFMLPLLAHHDKSQVEVFAYAQVPFPDAMTQHLRSCTDEWRNIEGLSDDEVADLVRQDQIDVLVDLTMHMADNRLLVFARKPAPVQVTYLAYCSSTGMTTMDYRLSDAQLDPPGGDDTCYSEQTIRLPETYWCYQASIAAPEVGPLPALERGHVTFGCLNNFCKVSRPALQAWAKILLALPKSRLLLHALEGGHRQRVGDLLAQHGVESSRVEFAGSMPQENYFQLYQRIDIALDTFPYGGGTTTCDSLWMGVPVVSLAGNLAVGRGGLSILSNIGLPDLAALSEDEYVQTARNLAGDLPRMSHLRATFRRRMEQSPLMNAPRFTRNVEAAFRQMWRKWCITDCI